MVTNLLLIQMQTIPPVTAFIHAASLSWEPETIQGPGTELLSLTHSNFGMIGHGYVVST